MIYSAAIANNNEIFPNVLALHVPVGSVIADVTFARGTFWKDVDLSKYDLLRSDIKMGVDCRALPYADNSVDAVVLDPPYISGFFRRSNALLGAANHRKSVEFINRFSSGEREHKENLTRHAAVLDLYFRGGLEARRVLKNKGVLIVKTMDEIDTKHFFTHVEIMNHYEQNGFVSKDLFVVVHKTNPILRHKTQKHARKNHSYFLVFVKT